MTATFTARPVAVDDGSPKVLAGLALPFNEPSLVVDYTADGRTIVLLETFDAESVTELPAKLPLLASHDRANPTGWVTPKVDETRIAVEGTLSGSAQHIEHLGNLIRDGLMSGLSVAFLCSPDADVRTRGPDDTAPPEFSDAPHDLSKSPSSWPPPTAARESSRSAIAPRRRSRATGS